MSNNNIIFNNMATDTTHKCLLCNETLLTKEEIDLGGVCYFCELNKAKELSKIAEKPVELPVPEVYGRVADEQKDLKKNKDTNTTSKPPKKKKFTKKEREQIYKQYGFDPEAVLLEPTILRASGPSEDVYLELSLPRIADNYVPEFQKLLENTLKFIVHVNAFGPQHPSTLPQLAMFLGESKDGAEPFS